MRVKILKLLLTESEDVIIYDNKLQVSNWQSQFF